MLEMGRRLFDALPRDVSPGLLPVLDLRGAGRRPPTSRVPRGGGRSRLREVASQPPGGSPLSTSGMLDVCDPFFRGFPGYGALNGDDRDRLRASFAEALAAMINDDGMIDMPTEAFVAVGSKPA